MRRLLAAVAWLGLGLGCATDRVDLTGGRVGHARLGFSVAAAPSPAVWTPIDVKGAWLAHAHPGGALASLQTRCFDDRLSVQLRARHLLIGVRPRTLRQAGPVAARGLPGWSQVVDVGEPAKLTLKTLTVLADACAIDWVLSVPHDDFAEREAEFDAWWATFERGPS